MKKQLIGGAAIMLMAASGAQAGQGCSSITDYSNVWAVSGSSDSLDSLDTKEVKMPWRISLDYSYVNANQLIRAGHREQALEASWPLPALGVRNRYQKAVFGASYDFSSRLMAGVSIPYIYNHRWEDHNPSLHTGIGIGDITAFGRYWIKQEKDAFNFYVEGALGLPTGKSNETYTFFNEQGVGAARTWVTKPRAAYIEPGLGQFVPTIATGFETKFMENNSLYGRVQYSDPLGKNDAGYSSQSTLMTNIGASRTFTLGGQSSFGVSGQFSHIFARFRRDSRDSAVAINVPVNNTGGTWLDFQPGAFYSPDGKLMFTVSVPISLHYHVNSLQTYAPYSLNLGVSQRF